MEQAEQMQIINKMIDSIKTVEQCDDFINKIMVELSHRGYQRFEDRDLDKIATGDIKRFKDRVQGIKAELQHKQRLVAAEQIDNDYFSAMINLMEHELGLADLFPSTLHLLNNRRVKQIVKAKINRKYRMDVL